MNGIETAESKAGHMEAAIGAAKTAMMPSAASTGRAARTGLHTPQSDRSCNIRGLVSRSDSESLLRPHSAQRISI